VESASRAGRQHRDSWLEAKAYLASAQEGMFYGDLNRARENCQKLAALSRESNDTRPRAMGLWQASIVEVLDFTFDEAKHSALEANQVALSPVDRHSASAAYYAAMVLSRRAEEIIDPMRELRELLDEQGFFGLRLFVDCYLGVGEFMCGQMARGVGRLKAVIDETERPTQSQHPSIMAAFGYAVLGELYTVLALGEERPDRAVLMRNAGFLIRAIPSASSRARTALGNALRLAEAFDAPLIMGWVMMNQGLLLKKRKNQRQAGELFSKATALAEAGGAFGLGRRIADAAA